MADPRCTWLDCIGMDAWLAVDGHSQPELTLADIGFTWLVVHKWLSILVDMAATCWPYLAGHTWPWLISVPDLAWAGRQAIACRPWLELEGWTLLAVHTRYMELCGPALDWLDIVGLGDLAGLAYLWVLWWFIMRCSMYLPMLLTHTTTILTLKYMTLNKGYE